MSHAHAHEHNDISHVASVKVLLGTFAALMVFTLLTVAAVKIDLGSSMNLVLALIIATIKATLVCMYFMHLKYDKALYTVALLAALLFAMLFASFVLMDVSEFQVDLLTNQPVK